MGIGDGGRFGGGVGGRERGGGGEGGGGVLQRPVEPAGAGGRPALQALGGGAAGVLGGGEGAQLSGLQGFESDDALGLRPLRQRGEVAAVGVERVRGHAALDFEVDEVVGGAGGRDRKSTGLNSSH